MNLKELTQEYLRKEGFCPEETDFGLYFKCEGKNFLLIYDDDDEQYFRLMMPCIFEMTDENEDAVYRAMNEVNSSVKVIKAYIMRENEVWLGFEVLAGFGSAFGLLISGSCPRSVFGLLISGSCPKFVFGLKTSGS